MVRESRSPSSNSPPKSADRRGIGTSPVGRKDSGYGSHALRHVGKNSATPAPLRTAGPVAGEPFLDDRRSRRK
jgi:hypothetical protein